MGQFSESALGTQDSALIGEHVAEFASIREGFQLGKPADGLVADKNLWHGATSGALDQLLTHSGLVGYIDFLKRNSLGLQQRLCCDTVASVGR